MKKILFVIVLFAACNGISKNKIPEENIEVEPDITEYKDLSEQLSSYSLIDTTREYGDKVERYTYDLVKVVEEGDEVPTEDSSSNLNVSYEITNSYKYRFIVSGFRQPLILPFELFGKSGPDTKKVREYEEKSWEIGKDLVLSWRSPRGSYEQIMSNATFV